MMCVFKAVIVSKDLSQEELEMRLTVVAGGERWESRLTVRHMSHLLSVVAKRFITGRTRALDGIEVFISRSAARFGGDRDLP